MNVLVTGGAGYVGAVLIPKLLKKGHFVKVVDWYIFGNDVFASYKKNPRLTQIKGDLRDKNLIKKALTNVDAVIHLAAISNDPSFDLSPALGKSVNYDATVHLFNQAKSAGVGRFIFASSSSVYGIKKEAEVTEDLPLDPLTDYSKYKALCEEYLLKNQSPEFCVLIIRPATVCGYSKRLRLDLTVNMLTMQALVKGKITVLGGSQKRPNIHIDDITDLYVKTLEYPSSTIAGKIYNAGYENQSLLQIAKMIKRVLKNRRISIEISKTSDLRSYKISSQKIKKELKFFPKHSIEDAVNDLKGAYMQGKIPEPFTNPLYYNIQTLKSLNKKVSRY